LYAGSMSHFDNRRDQPAIEQVALRAAGVPE
jgi:hypothetical protein